MYVNILYYAEIKRSRRTGPICQLRRSPSRVTIGSRLAWSIRGDYERIIIGVGELRLSQVVLCCRELQLS